MKKPKCLVCGAPATIKKEVLIALSNLYGCFKSTNKTIDFCRVCYPQALPLTNFEHSLARQKFVISRMRQYSEAHKRRNENEIAKQFEEHCLQIVANIIKESF